MRDVVIIGGGHNGLVAAALLARAGLKPLVLERADRVGGCAVTSEIAPGYRCPTLAHRAALDPHLVSVLELERHGLNIVRPEALVCAPTPDGRALTLWADTSRAVRSIAEFSQRDAEQYAPFLASVAAIGAVLRRLTAERPPSIDGLGWSDLLDLAGAARRFRRLGRTDAYRLLRWFPMPIADLLHEWFESEPLCASIAAGGLVGSFAGPRSPGTSAALLLLSAGEGHPVAPGWTVLGGTGAVSDALAAAATRAGAEIRIGSEVRQILVRDGIATGVVHGSGEEVPARHVVSNADPHHTLLDLVDPVHLAPDFRRAVGNIRMRGTLAKINFATSSLPSFSGLARLDAARREAELSGCVRLGGTLDSIERAFDSAKYGAFAEELFIELTIPTIADRSLAPPNCHVVSAYVLFAPYELRGSSWDLERERLADAATRVIATYAPGFERTIVARQTITPFDLERTYALTGGHVFHGELALDQLFVGRPLLGWSRYRTPITNLFLCGAGTHPGTGLDGRAGMLAAREIIRSARKTRWDRSS